MLLSTRGTSEQLRELPNLPADDVPDGKSLTTNVHA